MWGKRFFVALLGLAVAGGVAYIAQRSRREARREGVAQFEEFRDAMKDAAGASGFVQEALFGVNERQVPPFSAGLAAPITAGAGQDVGRFRSGEAAQPSPAPRGDFGGGIGAISRPNPASELRPADLSSSGP